MKMKCEPCKGETGNKSCKACGGTGQMEKGYSMNKASVALKGLSDYLPHDEALTIVKGKIASGDLTDDLGGSNLSVSDLDAAVQVMKASIAGDYTPGEPSEDVIKGGASDLGDIVDGDGMLDVGDAMFRLADADTKIAKGLNQVGRDQRANHEVLAKGTLAMATLLRDAVEVIKGQSAVLDSIQDRQDDIAKAMGRPVPPRSVLTGARPVPAPGENGVARGGVSPVATVHAVTGLDVSKAAKAEMDTIIKGGGTVSYIDQARLKALGTAIARCESGIDGKSVAAEFNIAVA